MKLLFNHHLSPSLANSFQATFPGSAHVFPLGMGEANDDVIWQFAKDQGFVIVTKDSDYHDLGMRLGFPPFVVLIKRGNCKTSVIRDIISKNSNVINDFVSSDKSGILILF